MNHVARLMYCTAKGVFIHDDFGNLVLIAIPSHTWDSLVAFHVGCSKDWYMQ